MKRIWAPWRMEYIRSDIDRKQCIFCIKATSNSDEENFILHRGKAVFALLNIFPYTSGHILVSPYRHTERFENLTAEELGEMMNLAQRCVLALSDAIKPEGFNMGFNQSRTAGSSYDHIHFHIVPRWTGDTNFMPVIADTKVMTQHLSETYKQLQAAFQKYRP